MIIVAVAAIIVLELAYTMAATRLSVGQRFKYYMDEDIYYSDASDKDIYDLLGVSIGKNGKTFSYEVLSVETERLNSSYNVLSIRLAAQEGDAIFTSSVQKEDGAVRVKQMVDGHSVYYMEGENGLLARAENYLKTFIADGGDVYTESDYDENKIRAYFDERMKGDNRFRTEADKEEGRENEIGRIKKLAKEVKDFKTLLSVGEEKGLFYRYTKYEQSYNANPDDENYKAAYEKETEHIYGINMGALTGGKKNVSEYLKISDTQSAQNVVLVLFDFGKYQEDLQFECISFVNTLVREFSDFLE